jgi:hypothetical protein
MPSPLEARIIEASRARPAMKTALRAGGACRVALSGNRKRVLVHHPMLDAPRTKLPWPLSLLQQPTVRYVVSEGDTLVSGHIYRRDHVDEAIDYFLRDLPPSTRVTISAD